GDHVEDRSRKIAGNLLFQARDCDPGLAHDLADVGRDGTVQQLQDRTLAGAVTSEQADALPTLDAECGVIEDRRSTESDAHVLHAQQRHYVISFRVRALKVNRSAAGPVSRARIYVPVLIGRFRDA